ncbi:hypothetical protein ACWIYZ_08200, partial [Ursidibacter arcticus]
EPAKPAESAKPAEQPTLTGDVNVDADGKQWRIVKLNGEYAGESKKVAHLGEHRTFSVSKLTYRASQDIPHKCDELECSGTILDNNNVDLNLVELAKKDGKPLLGVHQGQYINQGLYGEVVNASVDAQGQLVTERIPAKDAVINYLVINQPYSSYGMIYTNENDVADFHSIRRATGDGARYVIETPEDDDTFEADFDVFTTDNNKITWNDAVKGSATYKGSVIATSLVQGGSHLDEISTLPKLDGTVILNANFGETWNNTYVSGEINSSTMGKIELQRSNIQSDLSTPKGSSAAVNELKGTYLVRFGGKDLNEAVGEVGFNVNNPNVGEVKEYFGVFGAAKSE